MSKLKIPAGPKQITAKAKKSFTEVQVRIHNTQFNFRAALSIACGDLLAYVDRIRKEAKNFQGVDNHKEFAHLPLVAFADPSEMEEVVFKDEKDFPTEPTELRTKSGTLIAKLT